MGKYFFLGNFGHKEKEKSSIKDLISTSKTKKLKILNLKTDPKPQPRKTPNRKLSA